jgi:hypothetical protein
MHRQLLQVQTTSSSLYDSRRHQTAGPKLQSRQVFACSRDIADDIWVPEAVDDKSLELKAGVPHRVTHEYTADIFVRAGQIKVQPQTWTLGNKGFPALGDAETVNHLPEG